MLLSSTGESHIAEWCPGNKSLSDCSGDLTTGDQFMDESMDGPNLEVPSQASSRDILITPHCQDSRKISEAQEKDWHMRMMQHPQEPRLHSSDVSAQTPPHIYFSKASAAPADRTLFNGSPKFPLSSHPAPSIPSLMTLHPEQSERPQAVKLVSLQNLKLSFQELIC